MLAEAVRKSLLAAIALALLVPAAAFAKKPPETTPEGLVLRPGTRLELVYLKPDAKFDVYDQIALLPTEVAFKKNWERDHRSRSAMTSPSKSEMDQIRSELGKMFDKILLEELNKAGYQISDHTAPDVLLLRPAIIDLDITAPDTSTSFRTYTIASSAGGMTLVIAAFDSTTAELLGQAMDREEGRDHGNMMSWQNTVTNRGEAERIMRGWSTTLAKGLGDLGTRPGQ